MFANRLHLASETFFAGMPEVTWTNGTVLYGVHESWPGVPGLQLQVLQDLFPRGHVAPLFRQSRAIWA